MFSEGLHHLRRAGFDGLGDVEDPQTQTFSARTLETVPLSCHDRAVLERRFG